MEKYISAGKKSYMIGGIRILEDLLKNEAFGNGIVVGINLYQQRVIEAHRRKEPLKIGNELFYLQNGRERLEQMLNEICK